MGSDEGGDRVLAERVAALIDLTDLRDDHAPDGIDDLCARARHFATAAVCVWPEYVPRCVELLTGSDVRVATVVNFPSGEQRTEVVVAETRWALDDGADEIDVVMPWRAFAAGRVQPVHDLLSAVRAAVPSSAHLKVILESGGLGERSLVRRAADVAIDAGADFVKTSTGKIAAGASLDAAAEMLDAIAATHDRPVGLKPSGGISDLPTAAAYLDLADRRLGPDWATPATFRFGASGLLGAVADALGR